MSRENSWSAPDLPPPHGERAGARRVASRAATTGTLLARAYDRLAERFVEHFEHRGPRTFQGLWNALASAREALVAEGTITETQGQRLQEWVVRDLEHLAAVLVRGPRSAAGEARELAALSPGALPSLLAVLDGSGDALYRAASHARGPGIRRAGEVTCAGIVSCTQCGRTQRLAASTRLEHCGGCQATTFARGR